MSDTASSVARHLIEFLNAETGLLARDPQFDLQRSNLQKTQLMLELSRALRSSNVDAELLDELKTALARNAREIENQLAAVRELSNIVLDTLRKERDDGTYGFSTALGYHQ
ncbi:MAG: hypothetical protein OXR62_02320 [Ahrensia sp.]|nr:hypothetical protein [Ahrensia sp.]